MSKSVWAIIVIVVIVLAGGGLYYANKNSNNGYSNSNAKSTTSMNMNSSAHNTGGSDNEPITPNNTNKVSIKNFAFSPAAITVKVGTTVTWTNNDSTTHTVTSTDSPVSFDSGNLAPGKTYSFTFTKAGGYKYHCSIHTDMVGSVTVTE